MKENREEEKTKNPKKIKRGGAEKQILNKI